MNRPNYVNVFAKLFGSGVRTVISERIAPSQEYMSDGLKDKISKILIKNLYPKADKIIPNALGIKHDLIDLFYIGEDKLHVIHNPIDIKTVERLSSKEIDYRDKIFTFITVGRLEKQKNHQLLLKAMSHIEAKLYIIGDGVLRGELEKQIEDLGLSEKVFLLGRKTNPYKYISKADCFVFSSNYEGFPNVLLEALACELPIVSTDCRSGPREILAPKSRVETQLKESIELGEFGILTPINDVENLIKSMRIMMEDIELKQKYKLKSKNRANEFKIESIIEQYNEILELHILS